MNRIEFIGTSYVGKSTLYNALSERLSENESYVTEQGCRKIAREKMGMFYFLYRKALQKLIGSLGGNYVVYDIEDSDHLQIKLIEEYKNSLEICFRKDLVSSQGIGMCNKTYLFLLHLIARYNFYNKLVPNKTVIVEEAFIHWHLIYQESLRVQSLLEPEESYNDIGLFPKALIVCHADDQTILQRIGLRAKKNAINQNHINQSETDILSQVLTKQEIFMQHARKAESNNIKVLYLNTAEGISDNVHKMETFLQQMA